MEFREEKLRIELKVNDDTAASEREIKCLQEMLRTQGKEMHQVQCLKISSRKIVLSNVLCVYCETYSVIYQVLLLVISQMISSPYFDFLGQECCPKNCERAYSSGDIFPGCLGKSANRNNVKQVFLV